MTPPTNRSLRALAQELSGRLGYSIVRTGGRAATVFPDDRFIVSYPRSGNTWLTFLLTNLANPGEATTFLNLEARCPDIYAHSDAELQRRPQPRLLKSHEPFDPRYARVVYLVRDPRDVARSYFTFLVKTGNLDEATPMDRFVDGFVEGRWSSAYGSWGEHVGSWVGAREEDAGFMPVRYEDLHADTVAVLGSVAGFLGLADSEESCQRAVALCTPERMREMESEQAPETPVLRNTRLDVPFIGSAQVGLGRSELQKAQQDQIASRWSRQMTRFGYLDAE